MDAPTGQPPPVQDDRPALTLSEGRDYWWDGAHWQPTEASAPPNAKRSDDGYYWWDGMDWRRVPGRDSSADGGQLLTVHLTLPSPRVLIIAAVIAMVLAIAGVGGNWRLTSITSAETVATDYVSAVATGNGPAAWSLLQVASTTASSTLTEASFRDGMTRQGDLHYTGVHVKSAAVRDATADITVAYHTNSGDQVLLSISGSSPQSNGFCSTRHGRSRWCR